LLNTIPKEVFPYSKIQITYSSGGNNKEYTVQRLVITNSNFTHAYLGSNAVAIPELNKHHFTN
jgi:hypothetical protein